ncbi:MAG TPA: V-type ATP synthase subunit B [Thermoanaerobaculia bacterium]|nr:V-type ATP synthase subunit B [Thermoanaerobaculia bacterium]
MRGYSASAGLERRGLTELHGALAVIEGVEGAAFHDAVEIIGSDGELRSGRVLATTDRGAVIEVFAATDGMQLRSSRVRFLGRPFQLGVGPELLGRIFDGLGRPRDGLPPPAAVEVRPIAGSPINPVRREYPTDFLETGISAIDALNSVVLGQKIPIFTEAGLAHDALAMQIIRQARAPGVEKFAIVFAALGLPRETAGRYVDDFRSSGARGRMIAFLNYADDPTAERLITPRCALTAAEYLAFDLGYHVLVILHDITNYGEALREIAAARGEMPSRKGYPGYLYSDLASLFERAGRIAGRPGSLTQIPIVTLPSGDLSHPIPDLTGYVTEGQIVLDAQIAARGAYPPISVLASLSRLMSDGIGEGKTRFDHPEASRQLYAAVARVDRARALASIIGADELTAIEQTYLRFGDRFDREFLTQRGDEHRPIAETLDIAWRVLRELPRSELTRVKESTLQKVYGS